MDQKTLAVRLRLRIKELRMQELMEQFPPNSACELSEEMVGLLIESEELRSELKFLCGDPPDDDGPDAFVGVPFKPRPPQTPGAIGLREPADSFE